MIKKGKDSNVCDFCKRESDHDDFRTELQCGSAKLTIKGDYGSKMMDQSWGGNSFAISDDLCFSCAEIVRREICKLKQSLAPVIDITKPYSRS